MGYDGKGRALQGTGRTRGLNEIAPAIWRDVKVGKGKQHVMQRVDSVIGTTHLGQSINRMRAFDRDLIREGHYGQRPGVPHSKAEHMAAPTNAAT